MENEQITATKPSNRKKLILVSAVALTVLAALSLTIARNRNNSQTPTLEATNKQGAGTVQIGEDGFVPKTLYVKKGSTVTWTNNNPGVHRVASNPYPVTKGAEIDSVTNLASGATYSHTFNKPGTYEYHDELRPKFNAKIIVE